MAENFKDKYIKFASLSCDASPTFHLFLCLGLIGVLLKDKFLKFGHIKIFANFFLVILGESAFAHKSTALKIVSDFIYAIDPKIILPTSFSHEKIIEVLGQNPNGVFMYSEFRALMTLLERKHMQETKALFNNLFDNYFPNDRKTREVDVKIEHESLSISLMAATTLSWFLDSITDKDADSGFLNRFIFVQPKIILPRQSWPEARDYNKFTELVEHLKNLFIDIENQKEFTVDDDAKNLYCEFDKYFVSRHSKNNNAVFFSRLNIYCLKFAMCLAVINHQTTRIQLNDMTEAVELTSELIEDTTKLCDSSISFSVVEKMEKIILRILSDGRQKRSDLLNRSNYSKAKIDGRQMESILKGLEDKEKIESIKTKNDKNQDVIFYNLIKQTEETSHTK